MSTADGSARHPDVGSRRARVLVIDDEAGIREVLRRVLSEHDVVTAEDGLAALMLLAGGREFDLMLCDVVMPHMGGVEFWTNVVSAYPAMLHRIVFITGGALSARDRAFLDCAPVPVLEKPFSLHMLRKLVTERVAEADDAEMSDRREPRCLPGQRGSAISS